VIAQTLTCKTSLVIASLHIIKIDNAVNVSCGSQLAISGVSESLDELLVGSKVVSFFGQRRHLAVLVDLERLQCELSRQDLRPIFIEVNLPRFCFLSWSLTKKACHSLILALFI